MSHLDVPDAEPPWRFLVEQSRDDIGLAQTWRLYVRALADDEFSLGNLGDDGEGLHEVATGSAPLIGSYLRDDYHISVEEMAEFVLRNQEFHALLAVIMGPTVLRDE